MHRLNPNKHCRLKVDPYGNHNWRNSAGHLHRVDENGIQDGPAVLWSDGFQFWYLDGKPHRLGGPAQIYLMGTQYWYLDGDHITREKWAQDPRVIAYHSQTPEGAEEWLKHL